MTLDFHPRAGGVLMRLISLPGAPGHDDLRSRLTILHLSPEVAAAWTEFSGVRKSLERWRLLPPGSPKSAVPQLGIDLREAVARGDNPVKAVLHQLEADPAELIVLARHSHADRVSWLRHTVTEPGF